jgi:hypothetical protein
MQFQSLIMLHPKDTQTLSELKNHFVGPRLNPDFILGTVKCFKLSIANTCFENIKTKGYALNTLFTSLLTLPFLGKKTVYSSLNNPFHSFVDAGKDCFYRMKNSTDIPWRNILWVFSSQFIKFSQSDEQPSKGPRCLIFDDSVLSKTGKCIEKVSRIWDHVTHRYVVGFKLLVCLYYDGISSLPVDFSLHRERGRQQDKPYGWKKKEKKRMFKKSRPQNTPGYKRAQETDASKIDCAVTMIKRAVRKQLKIDYVLMDSWFTCWAFVELLHKINKRAKSPIHLIGMYKTPKTKFFWRNTSLTYAEIRERLGKPVRCRKLGYYYKEAVVDWKGQPIRLFFSKQGKRGKWKTFLTTDTSLNFIKMVRIYQIRWVIEVFFKEAKQLLGLGKCQSNDFDAQIADTTLCLIQHMILTLRWRYEHYEVKGALFEQDSQRVIAVSLADRLWGLLQELAQVVADLFDGVDSQEVLQRLFDQPASQQSLNKLLGHNLFDRELLDA